MFIQNSIIIVLYVIICIAWHRVPGPLCIVTSWHWFVLVMCLYYWSLEAADDTQFKEKLTYYERIGKLNLIFITCLCNLCTVHVVKCMWECAYCT